MNEQVVLFNYWVDCLAQSATEQGYFLAHSNKAWKGQMIVNWRICLFTHNKTFCL